MDGLDVSGLARLVHSRRHYGLTARAITCGLSPFGYERCTSSGAVWTRVHK